jgi:hypothetical protein
VREICLTIKNVPLKITKKEAKKKFRVISYVGNLDDYIRRLVHHLDHCARHQIHLLDAIFRHTRKSHVRPRPPALSIGVKTN